MRTMWSHLRRAILPWGRPCRSRLRSRSPAMRRPTTRLGSWRVGTLSLVLWFVVALAVTGMSALALRRSGLVPERRCDC